MVDEQTHIQLLKLDKETGQALGGAEFVVTDSKGNKVMKFVTKDDAYDITGKLVVGETYTFTEVSAPSGYQLAKPVQLTIKDTGKVPDSDPLKMHRFRKCRIHHRQEETCQSFRLQQDCLW